MMRKYVFECGEIGVLDTQASHQRDRPSKIFVPDLRHTATSAEGVGFVMALAKRRRSLR